MNQRPKIKHLWLPMLLVVLALFLRLYRIEEYMTFLGDEGRDALVWLKMAGLEKFTLIGPQTSIGNMYLGPLFYYLMLPFFLILGTVGPSIGTALFGGLTSLLLFYVGKQWFSPRAGLIAAFFYAVSPTAIILSRSAWNPNIMPLFALLTVWGIWQFWQRDNYRWLLVVGVSLSAVVQSHYLGLLLLPVLGLFILLKYLNLSKNNRSRIRPFAICCLLSAVVFVSLTVVPLVWFDLRHDFINFQAFKLFFTDRQATVNLKFYKALPNLWPLWQYYVTWLLTAKDTLVGLGASILIPAGLVFLGRLKSNKSLKFILVWLVIGLVGLGVYKQHIYDHYFGFLFPTIFLLAGYLMNEVFNLSRVGQKLFWLLLLLLAGLNLYQTPLKYPPNNQLQRTTAVAEKIMAESKGKPFNLGMIAKQNYDAGYQYVLEKGGRPAVMIDALRSQETITDQLFVVCEVTDCQAVGHPQAEIANFGWTKIDEQWRFPWGVTLFKLGHWQEQEAS